ncbi:Uncharacterised protein [Mycobacteroides abscessus subsp. abscessus]|nr:Uncharacterised protein [Mycobacteroides abscessus subsp. abscessus]
MTFGSPASCAGMVAVISVSPFGLMFLGTFSGRLMWFQWNEPK